jgi:hypothetical protein
MKISPEESEALTRAIERTVQSWFVETMHHSPISRVTEHFNHIRIAVELLKERLAAILQEQ